eukprot:scaffold221_cov249-Pinguiococcus_pyrenoidosus.AAC.9
MANPMDNMQNEATVDEMSAEDTVTLHLALGLACKMLRMEDEALRWLSSVLEKTSKTERRHGVLVPERKVYQSSYESAVRSRRLEGEGGDESGGGSALVGGIRASHVQGGRQVDDSAEGPRKVEEIPPKALHEEAGSTQGARLVGIGRRLRMPVPHAGPRRGPIENAVPPLPWIGEMPGYREYRGRRPSVERARIGRCV